MPRASKVPDIVMAGWVARVIEGDVTAKEAAREMGVSAGTVRSRVSRQRREMEANSVATQSGRVATRGRRSFAGPKRAKQPTVATDIVRQTQERFATLTEAEQVFVATLQITKSQRQAAQAAGIADSTASEWKRRPHIAQVLSFTRAGLAATVAPMMAEAMMAVMQGVIESVDRCRQVLAGDFSIDLDDVASGEVVVTVGASDQVAAARELRQAFVALADRTGFPKTERHELADDGGATPEERFAREFAELDDDALEAEWEMLVGEE